MPTHPNNSLSAHWNFGFPLKAGVYLVSNSGKAGFRHFDGSRFGRRYAWPWEVDTSANAPRQSIRSVAWLPCVAVSAPTKVEIKAGLTTQWRTDSPDSPGVYKVLSKLSEGTRDISTYRVWTGTAWGQSALHLHNAVMSYLDDPTPKSKSAKVVWQALDAQEQRLIDAIVYPVRIAELDRCLRGSVPPAHTNDGIAMDFIRRNPGVHAFEVGEHMTAQGLPGSFYAQTVHGLHRRRLVYRELSLSSGGPSFRYYAAGPSLIGRKAKTVDDVLIVPQENGQIVVSGVGGKFLLGPRQIAMLRAHWAAEEGAAA